MPYGYHKIRENVLCPNCLSLERHRILWLFLKNKTDFFTGFHEVMHVAPEQCFYERFRKMNNLEYTTVDLDSPIADVKADVQSLPFDDDTYDVVICNHVLEHVEDLTRALSELLRVLKPAGYAILQVPFDTKHETTYEDPTITERKEREKHFLQYDHLRLFGRDYPQVIEKAGFRIDHENYMNEITDEMKQKFRLPDFEFMYAFKK
jgi:SAM-dependent methyltransferase